MKILLGASLTQLGKVTQVGRYLEPFVGSPQAAIVIVTYFGVLGVLSGYFIMVVYLGVLIRRFGEGLVKELVDERDRVAEELDFAKLDYTLYRSLYRSPSDQELAVKHAEEYLKQHEGSEDLFGHLACRLWSEI